MSKLTLVDGPAVDAVTLTEVKAALRVDNTDSDDLLNRLIDAAIADLDGRDGTLGRALVTQTWKLTLDRLREPIVLPLPPLQSVTTITYVDPDGATQTLASNQYQVVGVDDFGKGRIVEAYGVSWPSTRTNTPEVVNVTFVAGYGDAATDVPEDIRGALILQVRSLYDEADAKMPMGAAAMLAKYRVHGF